MDNDTLTALQLSIKKWESIVTGAGKDDGVHNCALCALFVNIGDNIELSPTEWECAGCPVVEVTQIPMCDGSPYQAWETYQIQNDRHFPSRVFDERSQELAQAELDFLKSLLPTEVSNAT